MKPISIGERLIGEGQPCFLVAEVGINHNGDMELARKMIEAAIRAGADAVKFQTFKAKEFISDSKQTFSYLSQGKKITESMLGMFRRYEFSREKWFLIKKECDKQGVLFLSTPQNKTDLDLLLDLGVKAIKVGSDDFTNIPLLKEYARTGLPLILSSGMADLGEVHRSLDSVGALDGYPTILLHCTSQYPTPPEDVNLLKIKTLSQAFPYIPIGFSDHTQGPLAASLALAMGAMVFEKHFTMDHDLPGPDHWFSADPDELSEWISSIRKASVMLGNGIIRPTAKEKEMRKIARRSVVALCDIEKGEILTKDNIGLKRPGDGLPAFLYEHMLGLKSSGKIRHGNLLAWGDFK